MSGHTWIVEAHATYEDAEAAENAFEVMRPDYSGITVSREGAEITAKLDYGASSKYGAVRPAYALLHDVFDSVERDDLYRRWPHKLTVTASWQEQK